MFFMKSHRPHFNAIVLGASGGIGAALAGRLDGDPDCDKVLRLARTGSVPFDLRDEESIIHAAQIAQEEFGDAALIFNATGVLDRHGHKPEKALGSINPQAMLDSFAVNAVGAALVLKHFHKLLPRSGRSVFATLSARVGSIGDNRLGGWFSYRASKAALNQIVRTSAIEIARKRPDAICIALHPGTVATALSDPYSGTRDVLTPDQSAQYLLGVTSTLPPHATGGFYAWDGRPVEW